MLTLSERLEDIRLEFLEILFTVWLASPINLIPYADNPAISKTNTLTRLIELLPSLHNTPLFHIF